MNDARAAGRTREIDSKSIQVERARAPDQMLDADFGEGRGEGALGLRDGGKHDVPDQSLGRQIVGVVIVDGPGGAQDFRGGNFLLFAPTHTGLPTGARIAQI